ncbi:MAG: ferrous iron transport protein A [Candidatus Melainabacteria bacterium]
MTHAVVTHQPMDESIPLDQAPPGMRVWIHQIPDPETATLALRLGIAEGQLVGVVARVPGGPVVLACGDVEVALGRPIARHIAVRPVREAKAR